MYRRPKSGVAAGDAIPFAFDGIYHLFHLSSPPGTAAYPSRVRTTWHHVRSADLVNWEELPPALNPGEGDEPDADGAWTGSLIESGGIFHLYYTGHRLGSQTPQTICHATSRDLIHFVKDEANPIIRPATQHFEAVDWRDPFLFWNKDEQLFWMLIAARLRKGPKWRRGCIALATSPDLTVWTVEPEPLYAPMTTFCPECPELFRLGNRWYLVYSRFSENAATIYRTADNPRGPWRVPEREALDGRRWYASKSMPQADDARIFFGWIHDRDGQTDAGTWLWGGDFASARKVTADSSGALQVSLPTEFAESFDQPLPIKFTTKRALTGNGPSESGALELSAVGGFQCHIIEATATDYLFSCRFRFGHTPASFGLLLRADEDLAGHAIVFDRNRSTVALVHWPPPLDSFWADLVRRAAEVREVDGPRLVEHPFDWSLLGDGLICNLLVSDSIIEFYVGEAIAISYRIYAKGRCEVGLFVEDGAVSCDAIRLSAPKGVRM